MCERTGCCCLLLGPTDDEHVEWLSRKLAKAVFGYGASEQAPVGSSKSQVVVDLRSQLVPILRGPDQACEEREREIKLTCLSFARTDRVGRDVSTLG
jgi:hypothetical protein